MPMTRQQENDHDRSFAQAMALIKDDLRLSERPNLLAPDRTQRRNLTRASELLEHVLQINPDNWSAMWHLGKIYQRLEEHEVALGWFGRNRGWIGRAGTRRRCRRRQ
jgi:Flp pilus assembly protein TadD